MLINSNGLPVRVIGTTSVSADLVGFLIEENYKCEVVTFEDAKASHASHNYQYLSGVVRNLPLKNLIIEWLVANDHHCPAFVHPQSFVQSKNKLGDGTLIFPMASVLNSEIGDFCIVAPNCHVGHRAVLKNRCSLLPGSMVLGSSYLEIGTILQTRATVIDNIKISQENVNILPGSMVTKDITSPGTYGGSPARLVSRASALESDYFQ